MWARSNLGLPPIDLETNTSDSSKEGKWSVRNAVENQNALTDSWEDNTQWGEAVIQTNDAIRNNSCNIRSMNYGNISPQCQRFLENYKRSKTIINYDSGPYWYWLSDNYSR